jgi:hypothetical protein
MRDSEVAIHPNHLLAGLVPRPRTDELREKVYEVVQDHETKRQRDQDPVSPTNPPNNRVRRAARGLHVHRTNGEALTRSVVAISARLGQVRYVYRRARIGGRKNIMYAVTGSAVGNAQ